MSENRYFDEFMDSFCEPESNVDNKIGKEALKKAFHKINTKKRGSLLKYAAAACILATLFSGLIPNTPVNALYRKIFSFIPGVGVVQNDGESTHIRGVLAEPVRVEDGESFIKVESAFIVGDALRVSLKSNVGLAGAGSFKNAEDLKFFAGETMPEIYLQAGDEKVKPIQKTMAGPSFETMVYSVDAVFPLSGGSENRLEFSLYMDSFAKPVEMRLTEAQSGASPAEAGNVSIINDVMIFANTNRDGDTLSVLLSMIAPEDFMNARCYLFDSEKASFDDSVKIMDTDGNVYNPDDALRERNNSGVNTFWFNIPQDKEGLKIIIPQILYSREYRRDDIRIAMPGKGKDTVINRRFDLGGINVSVNKASIVPTNDPLLPDEFKPFDCMMVNMSATVDEGSSERVLRVIPDVEVPDGISGYIRPSSAVYAGLWTVGQNEGCSLTNFDGMEKVKKVQMKFDVECSMAGPWVIDLH